MFEVYNEEPKNEEKILNETSKIDYEPTTLIKEKDNEFFKNLVYIGQYNKTYLLLEQDDNLYIIDQHAAMERYMYEKIRNSLLNSKETSSYELLIPLKLEYNISVINLIMEKKDLLLDMHIEIESFGNNTILVRTIPKIGRAHV